MKNLYSYSCLILFALLGSCTNDSEPVIMHRISDVASAQQTASVRCVSADSAANGDNPYDDVGKLHNAIVAAYYAGSNQPDSLAAIAIQVKAVSDAIPAFTSLSDPFAQNTDVAKVRYILAHPTTCAADIISSSTMSAAGKSNLGDFMTTVVTLMPDDVDYEEFYDFVRAYESSTIADPLLTSDDKRIILITASITRYTVYRAKKKPRKNTDGDWTILIANIVGGIYGADSDIAASITTAITSGIAQNK
jgi:hypothetical protein